MIKARACKLPWIGIALIMIFALPVLILFNLNKIIAHNKDYFLAQAGQTLGRRLSAERVHMNFWSGIELRLEDFVMSDDAAFSSEIFLRAAELQINLKLLPLLKRELRIESLTLHDPEAAIIRDEKGMFNFSNIGAGDERERESIPSRIKDDASISEPMRLPLALVSLLQILEGKLRFADKKEQVELSLDHVNFSVKAFPPGKRYLVELSAAFMEDTPNLKLKAYLGPLGATMDWLDIPIDLQLTIDPLDTGKLKAAVPRIESYFPNVSHFSGVLGVRDMRIKGTLRELNLGPWGELPKHARRR